MKKTILLLLLVLTSVGVWVVYSKLPRVIAHTEAPKYVGQKVTVEGKLLTVFNNFNAVYLDFGVPHRDGSFRARINKKDWGNFSAPPEKIYKPGQTIRVTGVIGRYQGDYLMEITGPDGIEYE